MTKSLDDTSKDRFGKEAGGEALLQVINSALRPAEREAYRHDLQELPTYHVVGLPRSGTTLLMQILLSRLDFGYISNFIASFWQAPVLGIRLANKICGAQRPASFSSNFGRTDGISSPHEFGYFWNELLGFSNMRAPDPDEKTAIDWANVRTVIQNMRHAFGRPLLFKSFVLQWHIREFCKVMPDAAFIRIRRDPIDTALSLLKMRREFLGNDKEWASMQPREYASLKDLSVYEQVAGQVYFLEKNLDRELSYVDDARVINVSLDSVVSSPESVVDKIDGWVLGLGESLNEVGERLDSQSQIRSKLVERDAEYNKVRDAYLGFAGSSGAQALGGSGIE